MDLLQGTLDVLVLRALAGGAAHGYAIARFIHQHSGQAFRVLDGALYTALHRLEEREWVESSWGISDQGKRAKFYRLTAAGRKGLAQEARTWDRYVSAVAGVLNAETSKS